MTRSSKSNKSNEIRNERRRKKRYELNLTKPPQPPNRFILYRRYKQLEYDKNPNLLRQRLGNVDSNNPVGMRELSTVISEDWANEPSHVKEEWDRIAEQIKLTTPYNKNFDSISELQFELSTEYGTFVNATSANNSRQSFQQKYGSANFIFEPPCHTPLEPESPIQTSEDDPDDVPTNLFNELSLGEPSLEPPYQPIEFIDPTFIDPRLMGYSGIDGINFLAEEPMLPLMWESEDNSPLEISENLFESESSFSTPTEGTDDNIWEC